LEIFNVKMDRDTFSIVQSYFELEDILIIYKDNITDRDKLIQKYYSEFPESKDLIIKNHIESFKYLIHNSKI
jgi:hypothetical protein